MQTCTLCLQDILVISECDRKLLLDSCPGFEFFQLNIMALCSKKMRVSDEEMLYEMLQESEYSDI
jgi:hypothetical protein